jgi:chemotaxis signal transduction protein
VLVDAEVGVDVSERMVEAVRVTVGQEQMLVPTSSLQTIVEYRLHGHLPFLQPWVRGIGEFEAQH